MRGRRPEIGETLYFVCEHFYYIPNHAGPVTEYCVCSGKVKTFLTGRYTEMRLVGKNPDGFPTPYYYKLSDFGKRIFDNPKDAALLAKEMTEKYERTWGWTGDPPMRRTWTKYLSETESEGHE